MKRKYKNIVNNYNNIMNFQDGRKARNSYKSFMNFGDDQSIAYREALEITRYQYKILYLFSVLMGFLFYFYLVYCFGLQSQVLFNLRLYTDTGEIMRLIISFYH